MTLHIVVPLTSRLEELAAAVVLGDPSPFAVKEKGTIIFQYEQATGLKDLQREIMGMVCFRTLSLAASC
jgi:hypothetical protein